MTVSTESLQIGWVIVIPIGINVVHVQLARMDWLKATVLAVVFLMDYVWAFLTSLDVDAPIPSGNGVDFKTSNFDVGKATD